MSESRLRQVTAALGVVVLLAPRLAHSNSDRSPSITVVVAGDRQYRGSLRDALTNPMTIPLRTIVRLPPNEAAVVDDNLSQIGELLASARTNYINANFSACSQDLADSQHVTRLLAERHRELAARLLFWQVACAVGSGKERTAQALATSFASAGLQPPAAIETVSPEVEALLARASRAVSEEKPGTLSVTADVEDAVVHIDGRKDVCKIPCQVDLARGDHVIAVSADGYQDSWRGTNVGRSSTLSFTLVAASPDEASRQWVARYGSHSSIDSTPSVRLLARSIRNRRVVLVTAERRKDSIVVRGAIAIDGNVAGRAERAATSDGELAAVAEGLLRDLLIRGNVLESAPPLHKRASFWLSVGGAAAVATAVTMFFLIEPPRDTSVRF